MATHLDREILRILCERTGKKESTLRSQISRRRQDNPNLTSNAAAHLIARDNGTTVLQKLDQEDKESLRGENNKNVIVAIPPRNAKSGKSPKTRRITPIVTYDSSQYFVKEHIAELSRAYHYGCYTCVLILFRKILENCIIDILKAKFPRQPELVFDANRSRNHDFSVVLDNLYKERTQFTPDSKKAIERLNQIAVPFKRDANDKAHSWFHIVKSEKEIDQSLLEQALQLIKYIETEVGIR